MAQLSQTRATDLHGHREQAWVLQLEARDDGDHSRGVVLSTALGHCQLFAAVQYFIEIPEQKRETEGQVSRKTTSARDGKWEAGLLSCSQ